LRESEVQQAQVVMAVQDMVDRMQKMLEDISEMQFKDLPALSDSIKNDMGMEQASAFQSAAAAALQQLLAAVQEGKTQMEQAQAAVTGQAPMVPGDTDTAAGDDMDAPLPGEDADTESDLDLSLDGNLPGDEEELPTAGLGRERR
jgi:ribosomal protein L7/L12